MIEAKPENLIGDRAPPQLTRRSNVIFAFGQLPQTADVPQKSPAKRGRG
jgi:hypothetical protein